MRGREHHAEVGAELTGQPGDARGRELAEQEYVDPGRGESGDHGGLEELSGDPGVATDDRDGPVTVEGAGLREDVGGGNGKVQGQLSGEITVGQTPDPVRAEEASHEGISAC